MHRQPRRSTHHHHRHYLRRKPLGTAAVAVVLVAALAGCGGHTATRKDVIARGNAICSGALASIRAVPPPRGASAAALATYLKKVRPIVDREASQLASLPRPAARKQTLDAFIAAFAAGDRAYRQAAGAAVSGDAHGATAALAALSSSRVPQLAKAYGFGSCTGAEATVS